MSTDWRNEVAAKSFPVTVEGNFLAVILAKDALALLERCRVETLEEVEKIISMNFGGDWNVDSELDLMLSRVRALKTQRKEGGGDGD